MRQAFGVTDVQSSAPAVETLGGKHQERVTFLNPQYLVFPPHDMKAGRKIPLDVDSAFPC